MFFKLDEKCDPCFTKSIGELDETLVGKPTIVGTHLLPKLLEENDSDFWKIRDYSEKLKDAPPACLIGGWYDFFLPEQLEDYFALKTLNKTVFLTIGPWQHFDIQIALEGIKEGLFWFEKYLKQKEIAYKRKPVKLFIMGSDQWKEFDEYPPPTKLSILFLSSQNLLTHKEAYVNGDFDLYVYDPHNPTPSFGGADFHPSKAGMKNISSLELRKDVLIYSSQPLATNVEIIGQVKIVLYVSSTGQSTDFIARLCYVTSILENPYNITEGVYRLQQTQEEIESEKIHKIEMFLSPTAFCFKEGQRIRLHISSSAHPRLLRNFGTSEINIIAASCHTQTFPKTIQKVFHSVDYPSSIFLPSTKTESSIELRTKK